MVKSIKQACNLMRVANIYHVSSEGTYHFPSSTYLSIIKEHFQLQILWVHLQLLQILPSI